MNAETKIAQQRLSLLELAQGLGNVAEACRQRGVSRTQFYEYKKRFQTHGMVGLKDLPPIHQTHPQTTSPEVVDRLLTVSMENPTRGCNWLHDRLLLEGISVSAPTIQGILNKHEMGGRYERLLKLEARALQEEIELTPQQVVWLEKANPSFRERHVESSRPGELLCQDTFYVGRLKGVGKVYLHAVVDTFSSYAFGYLHTSKQPEAAALVVHNDVLPFYQARDLPIKAILTDNGREFCSTETHPYELYLALNDIDHRRTKVRSPQTNGFIERFNRTALDEFFRIAFRTTLYESVEHLQADFDQWLVTYNMERPHQGYRNVGRRPIETIELYLRTVREEG